jgi:predicted NACHT family NTPase
MPDFSNRLNSVFNMSFLLMAKRSLQASPAGIQRVKRAFALKGWTQDNLAAEVNLKTRQPIWRLFTGQPIDRQVLMDVCHVLDLDWREIAENPPTEFPDPGEAASPDAALADIDAPDIDGLVAQVRSQHHETIQQRCGILQLLDIHHPVNLDDIYVDVNILAELIASQQWGDLNALNDLDLTEFDRVGLGPIEQPQIPGMQAVDTYSKLRVLGKPGVGKTTFLQHLAVQCSQRAFAPDQVPIFIALREFAEFSKRQGSFSLFTYIQQTFPTSGLADPSTLETLLQAGRVLLLIDGMDEVPNPDITR